jgi:formylglycine-generating enzyme required for sulfatase activity
MGVVESGEYELAEPLEPQRPKAPPAAGQPLPRLWKTEPDEPEDEPRPSKIKESKVTEGKKAGDSGDLKPRPPQYRTKAKPSKKEPDKEGSERKVLVEETPSLDTYEARRRARLIMGGLVASCFLIFGWIFYRVFLYDPNAIEATPDDVPVLSSGPVLPKRDLETEAQSMFNRARENAKAGRTKEAIALLENVTKVYRGTKAAAEAKEALGRPDQNLPLFLDRPAVKAETAPPPPPEPRPAPPQVVVAQPKQAQGNATLVLPANPAELTPARPSPLAMATTPDGPARVSQAPRALPPGFSAKADAGVHGSGWPLAIVGDRDGVTMVFVPGGTFLMGNDNGQPPEAPAHQVRLSPYYIDQHEVTVRQFGLFLKETDYRGRPPHNWSDVHHQNASEAMPMVMVNAHDALAYAEWAQKRLPTEAQWELAARSTDGRLFPWGPEPINYARPRAPRQVDPVMTFPEDVSAYGVYDLAGNVWEWTKDWYDSKYYRQLPAQPVDNPTGPSTKPRSLQLVVKGGGKNGGASAREGIALEKRLGYVGFRCVLPVERQGGPILPPSGAPAAPVPGQPPASPPPAGNSQGVPVPF